MLVDLYPNNGSGSASCLNLMRCLLAALFTGVLDKMISSMGLGATYTVIAGLCLLCDICLVYVLYSANKRFNSFHL